MKQVRLGVLGAGQLGQMMAEETLHHGIDFSCYSEELDSPIKAIGIPVSVGAFDDLEKISKFLETIDILTFEFENIPRLTLEFLIEFSKKSALKIFPNPNALIIAQDRFLEKSHFRKLEFKTPAFYLLTSENKNPTIQFPWIIKTLRFGYDGKGQVKIANSEEFQVFMEKAFPTGKEEYLIEERINFDLEVSVILTRFQDGTIQSFGTIENIHENHILDISIYPARIDSNLSNRVTTIANNLAVSLDYVGTMGVEFFIKGEEIYLNEFAPRPHNSGHFSQDCGSASQFKLHIGAVTDLFKPKIEKPTPTVMKNLLGDHYLSSLNLSLKLLDDERYVLHLYGKKEYRVGRKMGHINFRGNFKDVSPEFLKI
jgi:5-(carboxyamino)imidazole ribonucleotide synthase